MERRHREVIEDKNRDQFDSEHDPGDPFSGMLCTIDDQQATELYKGYVYGMRRPWCLHCHGRFDQGPGLR